MSDRHLTENELVLLLDGEAPHARCHLDTCASCQARLEEFDNAISSFASGHRERLDEVLPAIGEGRTRLLARMEQATERRLHWWYPVAAIAACLTLIATFQWPSDLSKPRQTLTPGETRNVSLRDVCRESHNRSVSTVPATLRQEVFREYGIRDSRPGAYEVDYLITPELGGADSIRNLWPQPYSALWNAHVKDELEERLHGLVCSGQVDLATAQSDIARDWIGAYKKYFHSDLP